MTSGQHRDRPSRLDQETRPEGSPRVTAVTNASCSSSRVRCSAAARSASTPTSSPRSPARSPRSPGRAPDRRRHRRRQLLPRRRAPAARHGPRPRRLHGHARHRHELPGAPGLPREAGHRDPRADRDHHGPGRRALRPAPGDPAHGEGPGRDLRRRHGHAVLLHRHGRRPARPRDQCEVVLFAKNGVDGVYTADPKIDPTATKFDELTYDEAIAQGLQDHGPDGVHPGRENKLPMIVFGMEPEGDILGPCRVRRLARSSAPADGRARPQTTTTQEHT